MIEEGMVVEEGQVIAILDDTAVAAQLGLAIAELNATKTIPREFESQIRRARLDFERARSLVQKPVTAGGGFTRTGIGTIVDMDSLEVEVDVNESYIDRIYPGQSVGIKLNAYPEQMYEGLVLVVIPTADRNKATIRVRVQFVATDARVLPEMGVRVSFLAG